MCQNESGDYFAMGKMPLNPMGYKLSLGQPKNICKYSVIPYNQKLRL